jgi:FtsH-binding integral membrane protein
MNLLPTLSDRENSSRESSGEGYQLVAQGLLFSAALVAVFCAGGPHQGGMGIFLTVAGGVLLMFPLRRVLAWWIWGLAALFLLSVSLSLLPEKWLWLPAEWSLLFRGLSSVIPGFIDSVRISADPQNTIFWILVLTSSLLIGIYSLASSLTSGELRKIALLVCLGCSLYAALAMISWRTGWNYPLFIKNPWAQPVFGFFPNRNHTAGFLLTGALVALGLLTDAVRRHRMFLAFLATASFLLLTGSLLFFSISRGGVLFLLLGVMTWLLGLGKHRSALLLTLLGILLTMIVLLFLQSESALWDRLRGAENSMIGTGEGRSQKNPWSMPE